MAAVVAAVVEVVLPVLWLRFPTVMKERAL
jgi:hypothetical protein